LTAELPAQKVPTIQTIHKINVIHVDELSEAYISGNLSLMNGILSPNNTSDDILDEQQHINAKNGTDNKIPIIILYKLCLDFIFLIYKKLYWQFLCS